MYEIFEKLMKEFGYTAYKVSVETGIAQSTLSDWKKGKSIPKIDKIQKIAVIAASVFCGFFHTKKLSLSGELSV